MLQVSLSSIDTILVHSSRHMIRNRSPQCSSICEIDQNKFAILPLHHIAILKVAVAISGTVQFSQQIHDLFFASGRFLRLYHLQKLKSEPNDAFLARERLGADLRDEAEM